MKIIKVMIDDSEFESFVFCLAHKRVSSTLLKDHQDLVCVVVLPFLNTDLSAFSLIILFVIYSVDIIYNIQCDLNSILLVYSNTGCHDILLEHCSVQSGTVDVFEVSVKIFDTSQHSDMLVHT